MTWLDILCLTLVFVIASIEAWRGIVRAGLTLIGVYFGGKLSALLATRVAPTLSWFPHPDTNKAILFLLFFFVVTALSFFLAHLIAEISQFTLEESEHLISFPIGLLMGLTVTHWLLQFLVWLNPPGAGFHQLLALSPVAKELLTFQGTKKVFTVIWKWGTQMP